MTQRARSEGGRTVFPRSRSFGTAAATSRQRLAWIWTRESLLRLLLSFVLALALWLYISDKQNPTIARDYGQPLPISVSNIPTGVALMNDSLGVAYVRIKQTDPNAPVTPASFHVWVDLLGLGPGTHSVPVHVLADPGIEVVQQRPQTVTISLQRDVSRHVPSQPNIVSVPPKGYGYQVKSEPSTVTVSGPQDLVSQVAKVTFDLELAGVKSSFSGVYKLRPENSQGALVTGHITLVPSQVQVTVSIQPMSSYKTLPVVPQITGRPKTGYGVVSLVTNPAAVTLTGSPEALSRLSTVTTAPISVTHRRAGTFTVRARLKLPSQTSSHTKVVKVKVQLAPVQSSSTVQIAVIPVGVSPGLVAKVVPDQLFTTIAGPQNSLRAAGTDVQAQVNVTNYGVGTYTLPASFTTKDSLHVLSYYPKYVTVTISPSTTG